LAGLNDERLELEAFFNIHSGDADSFYWVDTDNVQQVVRFAQGKLPIIIKRSVGVAISYTCDVILEKVI
jgi:phage-related protein